MGRNHDNSLKSYTGTLKQFSINCRTFAYDQIHNYKLFPSLRSSQLLAAYHLDEDLQVYSNYVSQNRQPIMYRGSGGNTDSRDPVLATNRLEVSQKARFTARSPDYGTGSEPDFLVASTIIRVKFHSLPAYGHFEPFYNFANDKRIRVSLSYLGGILIGHPEKNFTRQDIKLSVGVWYHIKMTYTRFNLNKAQHDCSVGVLVLGVGEVGGDLDCE